MNLIACIQKQGDKWAIGNKNTLLFRFSDDLRFFKQHTEYKIIIMGQKTFESLPSVLENRVHIILTYDKHYDPYLIIKGNPIKANSPLITVNSVEDLFSFLDDVIESTETTYSWDDVWVIGGGQIYNLLLPYCDEAYISSVERQEIRKADTFIPNLDDHPDWKCTTIQVADNDPITFYRYVNLYKKDRN